MTDIQPQEVWYADFPFVEDETIFKYRPVVVLDVDDEVCEVLALKVTSRKPRNEFEIEIFDWEDIPLNHISTVDATSARLLPKSNFRRRAGVLSDADWENVTYLYAGYLRSIGKIF